MTNLGLKPDRVFHFFEEISQIPHGSRNTKEISDYCKNWAIGKGLEYYQDDSNNIIIIKEASEGRDNEPAIIIQGHLDMVCEKAEGVVKDMDAEGLDLYVDGDLLKAKGTTLGGDDGIAVAMAMAILEDAGLSHPRLEAVFTVDEEIGMLGAASIDVTPLKGRTMLNIDSEQEGVFTVSCAGGVVATCSIPYDMEENSKKTCKIVVSGLTGGHSGVEIHKKRATSNKAMAYILHDLAAKTDINLVSVSGGLKDNAIPVCTEAIICCEKDLDVIKELTCDTVNQLLEKYAKTDPNMSVSITEADGVEKCMDKSSTDRILDAYYCLPEGIQKMSKDVEGLVQTSLNMGILVTTGNAVEMSYCVRSSVDSEKRELLSIMDAKMKEVNGKLTTSGDYPGWEYKKESPLRDLMAALYKAQYGKEPVIEAIHAGVECGMFAGKLPGLDCVSYGPDLSEIHTYREAMSISSVQRVYKMTCDIIEHGIK